MSNAELVRQALEAALRRPEPDRETINALFHRDHVWISPVVDLEGPSLGVSGFEGWRRNMDETGDWETTLEDAREGSEGRVLVIAGFSIRGARGQVTVHQRFGVVCTVTDGRIVRTESFPSVQEAGAAAGVEP